ncbi:hypothetical protein [Chamaesiphon sp.]|uniref:hypothetical protein n=1 Tax=Chamaesiphon sp. TaxID=2814140 RepID=UPI003593D890
MKLKLIGATSIAWAILAFTARAQAANLGGTLNPINPVTGLPINSVVVVPNVGTTPVLPTGSIPIIGSNGNTYTVNANGIVEPTGTPLALPTLPSFTLNSSNPDAFTSTGFTVTPTVGSPIIIANPLAPCLQDPASCAANPETTFASFGNITSTLQASAQAVAQQYMVSAQQAATDWVIQTATAQFQSMFPGLAGLAGLFGGTTPTAPPTSSTAAERSIVSLSSPANIVALIQKNNDAAKARLTAQIAVDSNNSPTVSFLGGADPTTENGKIAAGVFLGKEATNENGVMISDSNNVVKNSDRLAQISEDDSLTAIQNLKAVMTGSVHQNDAILNNTSKQGIVQAQLLQQTSESQDLQRKVALNEADASTAYQKRNVYLSSYIDGISRVTSQP